MAHDKPVAGGRDVIKKWRHHDTQKMFYATGCLSGSDVIALLFYVTFLMMSYGVASEWNEGSKVNS